MIYLLFLPSFFLLILNIWLELGREKIGNGGSPIPLVGGGIAAIVAWVIFREWWAVFFILLDYSLLALLLIWAGLMKRSAQPYE